MSYIYLCESSSERKILCRVFLAIYNALDNCHFNPLCSTLESDVADANYIIETKRFTEYYWDMEQSARTIKCRLFKIIFVNV